MFALPEAKRVRREDLIDSDSEGEHDEDTRALLEAQIARSLGFMSNDDAFRAVVTPTTNPASRSRLGGAKPKTEKDAMSDDDSDSDEEEEEMKRRRDGEGGMEVEEYDFCLFGGTAPMKVVLEDETEGQLEGEGGLQAKPLALCLARKATGKYARYLRDAAVSGEQVLAQSRGRFYGMEYPWRVTHITTTFLSRKNLNGSHTSTSSSSTEEKEKRRAKPNKRARIARRTKAREEKSKAEAEREQVLSKEAQVAEKKKRLNRLKKLRRRAQEKEKKLAAGDGKGGGGGVGEEEEEGVSEGDE